MSTKQRFLSVDIFRGITIAAMIMVNNPGTWGAMYSPLEHSAWHGVTPTDLIFPFFLFIVGMSISFAYSGKKKYSITTEVYSKIISRSIKLIGLGLILAGFTLQFPFFKDLSTLRLPGVLQRIGIVFFFSAIMFLHLNWKALLAVFVTILISYWALLTQIPIDGATPLLTKSSNLASVVDLKILTVDHMWKTNYDPEGIFSTIPSIATTISGMLVGLVVVAKEKSHFQKITYFISIGVIALIIGYAWNMTFPANKTLWTSSYVLISGGWATIIFAIIYYLSDVKGLSNWGKPAIIFGSNAITVFFLSGIITRLFGMIKLGNGASIHGNLYSLLASIITIPELSSMVYSLFVITFYFLVALYMYKKEIFIKV